MNLKETLNLPDPNFTIPMKADLAIREKEIQARWIGLDLYHRIQKERASAPTFVLHDGPPYTNGPIHLGTAMNKILKDFVVKSQSLKGLRAPYVPGYDNHGLPIEQAVLKKFHDQKQHPSLVELRKACREHAEHYIGIQTEQFQRLGVFGLWEKPYTSMSFKYEAEIIRIFRRLVEGGFIYRGLRPVLWSPTSRTALADTEIIYKDHVSKSIHVAFPLKSDPSGLLAGLENPHAVIWTTTPWTIPANLALAFHPEFTYVALKAGAKTYIVLQELAEKAMEAAGITEFTQVADFKGRSFEGIVFAHPIFGRDSVGVLADYVTTEDGTGVVHTAPGHGREDFITGQKYHLPVLCPVDEKGFMTAEAGEFEGVSYKDCNDAVVKRLEEVGALLACKDYFHSYPHGERDDKPVIFRATEQWFISVDHDGLRGKMLDEINRVQWFPDSGKRRITAMIEGRPDWCISRQRPWGVGIPIFYGAQSGEPLLDPAAIEAVAQMVEKEGSDSWYVKEASEILPEGYAHPATGETEFRKETDVFDVWFDSACTSLCVLEGNVEPEWKESWPCDLYLEGSDQHRGWFNVSLIVGAATRGTAPYHQVLTHGMVLDEKGQKMSKRLGNVIDPVEVCGTLGADILRWWSASVDYVNDVPCGPSILKAAGEEYRRVRNSLRFLLGNLYDFTPGQEVELLPLDRWIVLKAQELARFVTACYDRYEFPKALDALHRFCGLEVSAIYADSVKDRMYCDGKGWPSRRSAQEASYQVLRILTMLVSPILAHTSEEVYQRIPGRTKESIFLDVLDGIPECWTPEEERLIAQFQTLLEQRDKVFPLLEGWRNESGTKDSQDVEISLTLDAAAKAVLATFGEELPIFFKSAAVHLAEGAFEVKFAVSSWPKCERSRLRRADVTEVEIEGEKVALTARDRKALGLAQ